jgi:outer membrane protein assembly factor BamB
MKVKVYCPCGAKFEFEVEPVHDRMPMSLGCPVCGADATELANEVIRQQLAAAPPSAAAPVAAPPSGGLRINRAAPAPVFGATEAPHAAAPRPAPQKPAPSAPVWQRSMAKEQINPVARWTITGVVALLVLAGTAWFWYVWFARDPRVVYSLDFPGSTTATGKTFYRGDAFYDLLAPNRLLTVKNQHVTLMDCSQQISLWSVPVPAGAESFETPDVIANTNNIWVAWPGQLLCVDARTGAPKQLSLPDSIISITAGSNMILVLSGNSPSNETVTKFAVSDGDSQTENITLPPPEPRMPVAPAVNTRLPERETPDASERQEREERRERRMRDRETPDNYDRAGQNAVQSAGATVARVASVENSGHVPGEGEILSRLEEGNSPLFDAGPNAVWFQSKLLEHREITREAMKPDSGKSVLDNPNVTASQGIELAQEMANKSQRERTGGVDIIDVSRYQVTLHRLFAGGVSDWTGEIIGPPRFVPLKTIDLIIAGTNLVAFDKNNKRLWDAKLTYPFSAYDDFGNDRPPCLETDDALYFADKGMLTRFDPATGNVRWRLTSVGISAVQADDRGRLYLDTTTLRPETIQYSQQVDLREHDLRVLMQVDPASGNILWRSDFPGLSYQCLVSGKFLYSTRVWQTQDMLKLEEGPDTHFTMKLLEPSNGKMVWNHVLDNKQIVKVQVQKNWILLQTADRVAVLKFLSF